MRRRGATEAPAPADTSHARILAVVRKVPKGRVTTYGRVAELAGLPRQARLVGYALSALPRGSTVPWHRVVNAAGAVSLRSDGPDGGLVQRMRLEQEGVRFSAAGRALLEQYLWTPDPGVEERRTPLAMRRSGKRRT